MDQLPPLPAKLPLDPASLAPAEAALRGRTLLDAGDPAGAFPLLLRALQAEPSLAERWLWIQESLVNTGMFDAARKLIGQVEQMGFEPCVTLEMRRLVQEGAAASLAPAVPLAPIAPAPAVEMVAATSPRAAQRLLRARKALASGRSLDAEAEYRAVLKLAPDQAEAINGLAGLLHVRGRTEEAMALLRQGIAAHPDLVGLPFNLAAMLMDTGRTAEAEAPGRAALALAPAACNTNVLMGRLLAVRKDDVGAERHLRAAVQADPQSADALVAFGRILEAQNREAEAEAAYRRAIALPGTGGDAHLLLSRLYARWGAASEAEAWLRKALAADPRNARLWITLGNVQFNDGRIEDALASAQAGLAVAPNDVSLHNMHLFALLHAPGPAASDVFAAHRAFGQRIEAPVKPFRHRPDAKAAGRRPRLGFVSGDFSEHVVSAWFLPLWERLAGMGYEIHAYSSSDRQDHVTDRLRGYAAGWRVIRDLSDDAVAALIRDDGIDILLDLSGHTDHNRLAVFARKPAPVQASYLGYPATTGMARMDYYLACGGALPEGLGDDQFTEKLVRLPRAYMFELERLATSDNRMPDTGPLPALANGYVTFGSFNRISKSGQGVVDLWARVLHAVPGSRFLVAGMKDNGMIATMVARFAAAGIAEERLIFRRHSRHYLRFHNEVDLILDSFPYAGGTTTNVALRMGVPVLTLAGGTYVTRVGVALAHHLGLEGFVASTAEEFVAIACDWSARLPELAALRARLPSRSVAAMQHSDMAARGFDAAFRAMWRRHCADERPAAITITADALGGPAEEQAA
jgi:predicted O-linked N-acetylglucosamine transferase (SPINDLY family)